MAEGTSLAGALNQTDLGEYRGKRITSTSIVVKNAGDGLSEAMEIAPEVLEPGTKGYLLLEFTVGQHNLKLIEKADSYELKQVLLAEAATLVDDQGSKKKIAAQKNRIEKAQEAAKGVARLEGTEDAIDGLRPVPDWNEDDEGSGEPNADD